MTDETAASQILLDTDIRSLLTVIRHQRLSLNDEKSAQAELTSAIREAGFEAEREKRLSEGNFADIIVSPGIVIEVKLRGANKRDIHRQLKRYARHDDVSALILVTNVAMGLPGEVEGKPVYFVSMGRAWL